jgi:hypothetical protein
MADLRDLSALETIGYANPRKRAELSQQYKWLTASAIKPKSPASGAGGGESAATVATSILLGSLTPLAVLFAGRHCACCLQLLWLANMVCSLIGMQSAIEGLS